MPHYPKPEKPPVTRRKPTPNREEAKESALWVRLIRAFPGWTQEQLAEAAGVHRAQISAYETGDKIPRPASLARLAAAAGTTPEAAKEAAESLRKRSSRGAGPAVASLGANLALSMGERTRRRAETALARAAEEPPDANTLTVDEQRAEAEALWLRLVARPAKRRKRLVELSPAFWRAALVERIAHESETAARRDADEALAFAELALQVAERVATPSARGYAYLCIANARRAGGDDDAADAAFHRARRLAVGVEEMGAFPFSGARILDGDASVRRTQSCP